MKRKEIRDTVAAACRSADKRLTVFNGKHIDDLADAMPAASVAFDGVAVDEDLSGGFSFDGDLQIIVYVNGDDDLLDEFVDSIIAQVNIDMATDYPRVGCRLVSLAYDRDVDPGVRVMVMGWIVSYTG